ncbi:MAG: ABC transporter substrate-binding protein [Nitrospirae bacterium]|nr:ABC transporter substrate-binding protein [Nitrospirota bacterium]
MRCFAVVVGLLLSWMGPARSEAAEQSAPTPPRRIVSLLPSITELMFDLGAGDRVVGISDYCMVPAGSGPFPRVGGLIPNLEMIAELRPDLILADTSQAQGLKRAREIGLRVKLTDSTRVGSLDDLFNLIVDIGTAVGRTVEARKVVQGMKERLKQLENKLAGKRATTVLSVLWWEPLMVAGRRSLQNEIIRSAGGVNVAAHMEKSGSSVSDEFVIQKNPDVIIVPEPQDLAIAKSRPGWSVLSAARTGRVVAVKNNLIGHYGPRLVEGIEELAKVLHPEEKW